MRTFDRRGAMLAIERDVLAVGERLEPAVRNVRGWIGRGYPTRASGAGEGTTAHAGGHTDAVADLIARGVRDSFADDLAEADQRLARARDDAAWLRRFVMRNTVRIGLVEDGSDCIDCGRYVARTAADPMRRGRCGTCAKQAQRQGKVDARAAS